MSTNRRKGAPRSSGEMSWSITQSVKEEVLDTPSKSKTPPPPPSSSTSPYMTTTGGLYDLDTLDEGKYLCI